MILYNVTINIDDEVQEEWLQWMKTFHIPDVMATGLFLEYKFNKVLTGEEEGGKTYAVQYLCRSMEAYRKYEREHAPKLQQEHTQKFSGKFAAFRTLMEVVDTDHDPR